MKASTDQVPGPSRDVFPFETVRPWLGEGSSGRTYAGAASRHRPDATMVRRPWRAMVVVLALTGAFGEPLEARAQDAMPRPADVSPGDPERGRALVADRQHGLCLLCHTAPIGEVRQQGNLAPPLAGTGGRWTEEQLRLRVFDSRRVNSESLMPAYGVADTGARVGAAWRGKPIFTAQQIEDVVAWLATLK